MNILSSSPLPPLNSTRQREQQLFRRRSSVTAIRGLVLTASIMLIVAGGGSSSAQAQALSFAGGSQSFAATNVCPSGQARPTSCSRALTVRFNVTAGGTLGTPKVLTLGAPNLDFTLTSNTCTGDVAANTTCSVGISFTPTAPGERKGAVQIFDQSGNLLASTNVFGIGTAPAIAFSPAKQIAVGGPHYVSPVSVAVDGSGNLFVADSTATERNGLVYKSSAERGFNTPDKLGTGFSVPTGVAIDGGGDVFVADLGGHLYETLAPGGYATVLPLAPATVFGSPSGVAVDGIGNVFVADSGNHAVYKVLAAGGYTIVETLGAGYAFGRPAALALDASGNIFVADSGNNAVYKIAAPAYTSVIPVGSGFINPLGVAVDASGNVFVSDGGSATVKEILASGAIVSVGNGFSLPQGLAVDGGGNLYVTDEGAGTVYLIQRSQPPALTFASTAAGSTGSDSPQSVQLENVGNMPLTGSGVLGNLLDFTVDAGTGVVPDCNGALALNPGMRCNVSFTFTAQSAGERHSAFTLSDNSLNGASSTQTIQLAGTGTGPLISAVSPNSGAPAAFITVTGSGFGATQGNGFVQIGNGIAQVVSWSDVSIAIRVPSTATTGNVYVYNSTTGIYSNAVLFTVQTFPTFSSISTTSGPVGTLVTLTGVNLAGAATVSFNGTVAAALSNTGTQVQVDVPPGATTGRVILNVNGVALLASNNFVVPPFLGGISPNYGAPSAFITLTGTSFGATQGYGLVIVGGARPQITNWSDTSITFRIPSIATSGNVVVETGGQISDGLNISVYPGPVLAATAPMSPTSGPAGTTITISGTYLLDGGSNATATFNGVPAAVTSDGFNALQLLVPAGAISGQVRIQVNGVTAIIPGIFTVTAAAPPS
jgi:large repetitive protein